MKKLILSALALFTAFTFVNAQETRPAHTPAPASDAERVTDTRQEARQDARQAAPMQETDREYVETFRRDINVNDEQLGRIRTLHTETRNSYNSIDPRYFQSNEVYRSRVQEILNERDERLRTILTPEQFSIYNTRREIFNEYDSRNFSEDLEQRRTLGQPDMRRSAPVDVQPADRPASEQARPAPNQARPAKTPGQIEQTPVETSPVPTPGTDAPAK